MTPTDVLVPQPADASDRSLRAPMALPDASPWTGLGAHLDSDGAQFAVWAPHAAAVSVIGDFNGWQADAHPLAPSNAHNGTWRGHVPGAQAGQRYKFRLTTPWGSQFDKADPQALSCEAAPGTASRLADITHTWGDADWMARRHRANALDAPMSIYEVHLGSWQRGPNGSFLDYGELGQRLADYCADLGFTHVELMPITEHPFYGSWGYQTTGYFAPTFRYGTPQGLRQMVDTLHQRGIGVILDWVPSHFPSDAFALAQFDGRALYELPDPKMAYHPQWNSLLFDYGRPEVRQFLIDSACFWLREYHFDGLRVDAVASMLYLDFAREPGQWTPSVRGDNRNDGAIAFLRELNTSVYGEFPDVQVIAEESSAWEGVSRPVHQGGLGFGLKWNMGWMNDTLRHFARPHFYRQHHRDEISFSIVYAFHENFLLPLSHDEVVHGKGSLLSRMPGDRWQQFAGLRLLYGYLWTHPGKKLLFMGGELAQPDEWHHEHELPWRLLDDPAHAGVQRWVRDLNHRYRELPALHANDFRGDGFAWAPAQRQNPTVLAFIRRAFVDGTERIALAVHNTAPQVLHRYALGVPQAGHWREVLNSDAQAYGGSGVGNLGGVDSEPKRCGDQPHRLCITVPPLATLVFELEPKPQPELSMNPPPSSRSTP
jgi:1,4-alpha-glucan branching enzyme